MTVQSVSFGRVTAVTGTKKKTDKLNTKMKPLEKLGSAYSVDVTNEYIYASTDGAIASAVRNGNRAMVYVTGVLDVKKVKNSEKDWDTNKNILTHMTQYIDLNHQSVNQAFDRIV